THTIARGCVEPHTFPTVILTTRLLAKAVHTKIKPMVAVQAIAVGPGAPALPSLVGRVWGRYQLLHRIAAGGMAQVYLARACGPAGFERIVAVKCCHTHLCLDQDFVTMFFDEARLTGKIHHPNVISTLDVGTEEGLYLVMEYVEGGSLSA